MRQLLALVLACCLFSSLSAEPRKFTHLGSAVSGVTDAESVATSKTIQEWTIQVQTGRTVGNRHGAAAALKSIADVELQAPSLSPNELDALRQALKTCAEQPERDVRFEGIFGLTKIASADAVPVFAAYLATNRGEPHIFDALARIGDAAAVQLLIQSLDSPGQARLQIWIVQALGQAATDDAVQALQAALQKTQDPALKAAIEKALDETTKKNSQEVKFCGLSPAGATRSIQKTS